MFLAKLDFFNTLTTNLVMSPRHSSENNFQNQISAKEMLEISNKISRNYSPTPAIEAPKPKFNINFSTQELLEISQNISLYYAPKISSTSKSLVLLPVDPFHLFVYWNLGEDQANTLMKSMHRNELMLRVYSHLMENGINVKPRSLYELPVHDFQARQKISLPVANTNAVYSASIGKSVSKDAFIPFVKSNETHTFNGGNNDISKLISPIHSSDKENKIISMEENSEYDTTFSIDPHYARTNKSGKGNKK